MSKKTGTILVVDDEPNIRRVLEAVLAKDGHTVLTAENGRKGLELLKSNPGIDVLITDLIMPDINGIELLSAARELDPDISVLMITAHGTIQSAVEAMKLGALDYICKPFDLDEIKPLVHNALERRQLNEQARTAPPDTSVSGMRVSPQRRVSAPGRRSKADVLVGSSPAMLEVFKMIDRVKDSRASVLIRGESGTGKEGVARALHFNSVRADKPFVPVACVALSEQLLQSELFGHEKGSFTGAVSQKKGRFEMANHGTLFLDEIGDIPPTVQMMLLRVLQEREFERVGGTETIKVDVRMVTATNQNLEKLVEEGKFREDLFYRLQVITLHMPPLRERTEDIPELVEHFIGIYAPENNKKIEYASAETLEIFTRYKWPGNVRELENTLERAIVLAEPDAKFITPDLLPKEILDAVRTRV
ncbi:MAG: sigma-54-dependent transcriptional regulator [Armatimonadota bacterium]